MEEQVSMDYHKKDLFCISYIVTFKYTLIGRRPTVSAPALNRRLPQFNQMVNKKAVEDPYMEDQEITRVPFT